MQDKKYKDMMEKSTIHSDAWPEDEKQQVYSEVHKLLSDIKNDIAISDITFRPLDQTDIQELSNLHKEWLPIHYENQYYYTAITSPNSISLGAFYNKKGRKKRALLVGAILARSQYDDSVSDLINRKGWCYKLARALNCCRKQDIILYIMTFGVVDELRRIGIGSELIKRCVETAREKIPNCKGISLHVIEHNHSGISFYKRQGYKQLNYDKNFYQIKGKRYGAYNFGVLFENKVKDKIE